MAPLTGRKVFIGMASAFGVIISVNLFLAYSAVNTFPGLEVKNSYVASQNFDSDRAAQEGLGWSVSAQVTDDTLHLNIDDAEGRAVEVADLSATFGRATNVRDDQTPAFVFTGQDYTAPVTTAPGNWNLRMVARAEDGTEFKQRVVVLVNP
ncbi:FixH family protein [Thalassorhabdomicrobium marinisediminis]|uniref:Nitrogen fixation protein FixH n=1 Tax=Thalassorhabdomicrobium marinisediminis TaxID=2170577 RepID=A0A2T7FVU2_9RHOB|nr:FixH family protein [Thalassorhabdomicrobium marinisediminis]PVA06274.1 nitrogen fixation protein FixH [Thalassorhabdomicrobium marinisediminis]